jgi:hypothetical protein
VTKKVMPEIASDSSRRENPVMCHAFLQPGRAYSFDYPRHNYRQLPTKTEPRRIAVISVRDTREKPLDHVTASLNPWLNRSRWLVTGRDLDKDGERSFYLDSMTNIQELSDDELQPLKDVEYIVVAQHHVAYKSQRLQEAIAYQTQRRSGTICAVLSHGPREMSDDLVSACSSFLALSSD